ncbi:helix-turn-helix domain-containing protein [Rhizobium alvei]|uniref:Helix-turn-helix domain-containing protein n=1 Tax=Rhizobium alvei TaxID=1132659 RepID=A0ABT8YQ73_9HYPH|nr:helix-turn-helix domain-containing protein [Rhizobium alvei]MDO6965661.1 helix-turn-helix domain-containing protein [Rhizobium alvei]
MDTNGKPLSNPDLEIKVRGEDGADQIAHFFDACGSIFRGELEQRDENRQYKVNLAGTQLGPLVLSKVLMTGGSFHYERDSRLIAASGLDLIFVQIITQGSDTRLVNGVEIRSRPGDVFIADLTRTMRTHAEHCGNFSFVVPRAAFGLQEVELDRLHDHYLPAESAAARLILNHIKMVWAARHEIAEQETVGVTTATAGLLAGFLSSGGSRGNDSYASASRYLQICQFIDLNLGDADLGPDMLAHRFNISRAALYRLFSETDGVANYIRERRLRFAFRRLTSTDRPNISAIGFSSGFGSVSSFIRAFKAKYGITPGETLERGAMQSIPAAGSPQGSILRSWIEIADRAVSASL